MTFIRLLGVFLASSPLLLTGCGGSVSGAEGGPGSDAGIAGNLDGSTVPLDAATPGLDGSIADTWTAIDSGSSTRDSGTATFDSGTSTLDSGTSSLDSGISTDCLAGQTSSTSCSFPFPASCPPGSKTRSCSGGSWGPYGSCIIAGSRYYGDGGKHCGAVVCIQLSALGDTTNLTATVTKLDGSAFVTNFETVFYSPTTGQSYLGYNSCGISGQTTGKTSVTFTIPALQLGLSAAGQTIEVNAQVVSNPCPGGANYISGNASASRCN